MSEDSGCIALFLLSCAVKNAQKCIFFQKHLVGCEKSSTFAAAFREMYRANDTDFRSKAHYPVR